MFLVGEKINTTRKRIQKAVTARDAAFIQKVAKGQVAAGANYVDVNAGTSVANEVEDLKWLVETVQAAVREPLCIDSANPEALEAALSLHKNGKAIINSITGEQERFEKIAPFVKKFDTYVVALTMDDSGMPEDVDGRVAIARAIAERCQKAGITPENILFDTLVRPIGTNPDQSTMTIDAVRKIKAEIGGVQTICGLSNMSFGLPKRNLINTAVLAIMIYNGLDGVIFDPTEQRMVSTVYAARAVAGKDEYGMEYITAEREGKLLL